MPESTKSLKLNPSAEFRWLRTGQEALEQMLAAIQSARRSVCLEMYIVHTSPIAEKYRQALVDAAQRGVAVKVLVDALGSMSLPDSFWNVLRTAGGQFRWFNPLRLNRLGLRDHRKILVCDDAVAFIGGFNISTEYQGDGVRSGWRDLGLKICGPFTRQLHEAFEEMFAMADLRQLRFARLRKSKFQKTVSAADGLQLLLTAPGRQNPLKQALRRDLRVAKDVRIICAYFLPPWSLRRDFARVVKRGGRVQLILPAKSDVPLSRFAGQSLYRRLLQNGVEIFEYQPQILHAKLIVIDGIVYAGSANLDARSFQLNYELALRLPEERLAVEARAIFAEVQQHCLQIRLAAWRKSRSLWTRIRQRWAYFILARLDPYLTRKQFRALRNAAT